MTRRAPMFFKIGLSVVYVGFMAGLAADFTVGLSHRLVDVAADCGGNYRGATPASYLMPDYREVQFPSRDSAITIDAWWVPGSSRTAPAVVLAHGLGGCKRSPDVLFPAGALHRHGFSVLILDLRDEGSSTVDNGCFAGGAGEARDILGAWDWLRDAQGIAAGRIGLFGVSLGAGAAIIATGEEPRVAALWEDSGYADLTQVLRHQMSSILIPSFVTDVALGLAQTRGEYVPTRPVDSLDGLAGRPIAIVAGEADRSVPVEQTRQLIAAATAHGGEPVVWILPGVGHVGAMEFDPAEYERRLAAFFDDSLGGTAVARDSRSSF